MKTVPFALSGALLLCAGLAGAQTVGSVATASSACDSSAVQGLAQQLVALQQCRMPGVFVSLEPHSNYSATSTHVHSVMVQPARDAVWRAAGSAAIQANSVFRSLAEQYVLYHRSGCLTPARPGTSAHESGRAIDVNNYSAAGVTSALTAAGCAHTSPTADPVHFDCPGTDLSAENVRTFQHLWNLNNPSDTIAEDGAYGPQTEARLARSPANGFANAGDCGTTPPMRCTPHCEGTAQVNAACGRSDCAVIQGHCVQDALGLRCANDLCPDTGEADVCLPDGRAAHCTNGGLGTPVRCVGSQVCTEGVCVAPANEDAGAPGDDAATNEDAGLEELPTSETPGDDAGRRADVQIPANTEPPMGGVSAGGCGCRAPRGSQRGGAGALALLGLALRRRRRASGRLQGVPSSRVRP